MGVLRHRALGLFLLCVSLTSLGLLLLPSKRGSSLHQMVRDTVSRELSNVIQAKGVSSTINIMKIMIMMTIMMMTTIMMVSRMRMRMRMRMRLTLAITMTTRQQRRR